MNTIIRRFQQFPPFSAIKFILFSIGKRLFNPNSIIFYSQLGEDQYILSLLCKYLDYADKPFKGFYIDVGCNHPVKFSNTFGFYLQGWTGICIDANASLVKAHRKLRKADYALHAAISDEEKEVDFFVGDLDLVSTIDTSFHETGWTEGEFSLREIRKMRTSTLNTILSRFSAQHPSIPLSNFAFLTIDVEGHDFNVLKSIDLLKYRPSIITIEMHGFTDAASDPICQYLSGSRYTLVGYHMLNGYFVADELISRS